MVVKLLYFGRIGDRVGKREETLTLPKKVATVSALKSWLDQRYDLQGLLNEPAIQVALNQTLILNDIALNGHEEIGFLPPVGGG